MDNFKIEKVLIGDKVIEEITDEEGIKWYPFKKFLQSILCKYEKPSKFRDTVLVRHMRVIEYAANPRIPDRLIKTWCINRTGVRYLLRNMDVHQKGKSSVNLYRAREKGMFEACMYFKIRPSDKLDPTYINTAPKLDQYDLWSILCIENDFKLKANDRWKKCSECNYYYPDRVRYFGSNKKNAKRCLQCQGKTFECQNKIIQYIYNHDGYDLLYKLLLLNDNEGVVEELHKFIGRGLVSKDES